MVSKSVYWTNLEKQQRLAGRNLSDEELRKVGKRCNTKWNKFKVMLGIGEMMTVEEQRRYEQLCASKKVFSSQQPNVSTNQTTSTTNKTDQSIWIQKNDIK